MLALRGWQGWYLWLVLLLIIGVDHPPTQDVLTPLNWRRRLGGWLTIAVFILTFIPNPLTFADPAPIFDGETTAITSPARPAPPSAWRVLVGRAARGVAL